MASENIRAFLLSEAADSNDLVGAINNRKVIEISYDTKPGTRVLEPISYGISNAGNPVLRAWQRSGPSESYDSGDYKQKDPLTEVPGYRMFAKSRIGNLNVTDEIFRADKAFLRKNRPKHNKYMGWEDKDMKTIFASVEISKNIEARYIFDKFKRGIIDKANLAADKLRDFAGYAYENFRDEVIPDEKSYNDFRSQDAKLNHMKRYIAKKFGFGKKKK